MKIKNLMLCSCLIMSITSVWAGNNSSSKVTLDKDESQHVYAVIDNNDKSILAYGVAKDVFEAREQVKQFYSDSYSIVINDEGGSFVKKIFEAQAKIYYHVILKGEPPIFQAELFLSRIFKQTKWLSF
ncbi:MAG: hypothetical protein HRT87_04200 [Legionellales bacterium]|nr:hypothetical protein [Legionellales bacterium]